MPAPERGGDEVAEQGGFGADEAPHRVPVDFFPMAQQMEEIEREIAPHLPPPIGVPGREVRREGKNLRHDAMEGRDIDEHGKSRWATPPGCGKNVNPETVIGLLVE